MSAIRVDDTVPGLSAVERSGQRIRHSGVIDANGGPLDLDNNVEWNLLVSHAVAVEYGMTDGFSRTSGKGRADAFGTEWYRRS